MHTIVGLLISIRKAECDQSGLAQHPTGLGRRVCVNAITAAQECSTEIKHGWFGEIFAFSTWTIEGSVKGYVLTDRLGNVG